MMRILVDCMGGDNAPIAAVDGAVLAAKTFDAEIVLLGDEHQIRDLLPLGSNLEIVHTTENITGEDKALEAIKKKKNSSMVVGLSSLQKREADGFVSAGNTGALIGAATLFARRIPGVKRMALAPLMPTKNGNMLLIDAGANIACSAEFLTQFGVMGAIYMKKVQHVEKPRVGLLNIGTEVHKGNSTLHETFENLSDIAKFDKLFDFVGNIEARDFPGGVCDVLVCDGFAGNVLLKTFEGTALMVKDMIKQAAMKNTLSKLGGAMMKPAISGLYATMDYSKHGGAPMLGSVGTVIKAHGSSNAEAFFHAIRQAVSFTKCGVNAEIESFLK